MLTGNVVLQLLTDETRVRQIIMNGLTNAVKYSNAPTNGAIRVVVRACPVESDAAAIATDDVVAPAVTLPRLLCFDVLDRGPGLRGLDESVLFKDFLAPVAASETTSSASRKHDRIRVGSSGVGLPVCARCAAVVPNLIQIVIRCAFVLPRTHATARRLAWLLGGVVTCTSSIGQTASAACALSSEYRSRRPSPHSAQAMGLPQRRTVGLARRT
jgi:hypothetical protein